MDFSAASPSQDLIELDDAQVRRTLATLSPDELLRAAYVLSVTCRAQRRTINHLRNENARLARELVEARGVLPRGAPLGDTAPAEPSPLPIRPAIAPCFEWPKR